MKPITMVWIWILVIFFSSLFLTIDSSHSGTLDKEKVSTKYIVKEFNPVTYKGNKFWAVTSKEYKNISVEDSTILIKNRAQLICQYFGYVDVDSYTIEENSGSDVFTAYMVNSKSISLQKHDLSMSKWSIVVVPVVVLGVPPVVYYYHRIFNSLSCVK